MPRTIESIVECHATARKRMAAGLPVWDKKINIAAIIGRDPSNDSEEHAAAVANEIAALLRFKLPAEMLIYGKDVYDETISDVIEAMEALRPNTYADDASYSVLKDLNHRLEELYDWADTNRVWLGS